MSIRRQALFLFAVGCMPTSFGFFACSSEDSDAAFDASSQQAADADPNAPDADPNAPDADPSAPDASPVQNTTDAAVAAPDAATVTGCSTEALELITMLNDYRLENALPAIPASPSLCLVGDLHTGDLVDNSPDAPANCNMHSWSDQGAWSACCYTADHAQAQCMWDKPKELTTYPSNGYENSASTGGTMTPTQALSQWKNSSAHNAVMLNESIWAPYTWQAVGAGFKNGYAVLWFGTAIDPAN